MPKKILCKHQEAVFQNADYLRKRELGWKREIGYHDKIARKIVYSLEFNGFKLHEYDGGIFNLEFSLDGSILAAACEKKSVLLYDALNQKEISSLQNAHLDCVNCIRFLDTNNFATGSDDSTVKTWDIRYLKTATRTLRGHSNWVKNIEYSSKNRLITSAFDGCIYAWDLNNYTEQGVVYDQVFVMDGLMRMKITPDGTKMVICTTHGYILVIHNLNLETLNCDLHRFKPNIYRLMQESEQNIPIASCSNNLFSPYRKQNRVELISDFPNPNTAEVISSLQIHPMGWCALTRNINSDELSEWTSVHDIQERDTEDYLNAYTVASLPQNADLNRQTTPTTTTTTTTTNPNQNEGVATAPESRQTMDLWMGFMSNHNIRAQRMLSNRTGSGVRAARTSITVFNSGILSSDIQGDPLELITRYRGHVSRIQQPQPQQQAETSATTTANEESDESQCKIVQNLPRLTHFVEEPSAGKGFIKELCFSTDGRIICSPYNSGVRLFGFNKMCNELSVCVPEKPEMLFRLAHFEDYHSEIVVSCKFNPKHWMLVSGCLGGQIVWYNPVL